MSNRKIKLMAGNLLSMAKQGQFDVIGHGCNCFHTFGAGIAKSFKEEFPTSFEADKTSKYGDTNKLGTWTSTTVSVENNKPLVILNLYTQFSYGLGKDHFSYQTFVPLLEEIKRQYNNAYIGLPLIGCNRAGGNINQILKDIVSVFQSSEFNGTLTLVELNEDFLNKNSVHRIFNNLMEERMEH